MATAAGAVAVLVVLALAATRFSVLPWPPSTPGGSTATQSSEESAPPAAGDPDQLTVVDPADVVGVEEVELAYDGGAEVAVAYPAVQGADPFTAFLADTLATEVHAFEAANPGARSYTGSWGLTAAAGDVLGVRVTATETDSEESRERRSTYWYETDTGLAHGSTALIAGQEELAALNGLVLERVSDQADGSVIHPISSVYDSVGFNPAGDLVVEFDDGQAAPVGVGRVHAVVERDLAEPLLSELGLRARDAATVAADAFSVPSPPATAGGGTDTPPPGVLSPVDDTVDCSDPATKCVALTYDDGPGGGTPALLDTLAEHDARATFFVTGVPVMSHATTVRRAYAEGHEMANHTLNHPDLSGLSQRGARSELEAVQALVYRETGYTMDMMRPPYGATDEGVTAVTSGLGLSQIIWNVDTHDWRDRDASLVTQRALSGASDGAIILMHDIHPTTIAASRRIISELDARGFTMVTVTQLLGPTTPGGLYTDGVPEAEQPSEASGTDAQVGEEAAG
ncbi:polysaccharide deacetylase family protein [Nocardiopsis sp. CNT312]|uniref:polysaccharide deacetylase family protein n=1 Tax=Nocardiopsis sp. CNT312 TaxID=1137268 RepID=UPI0004BA9063|nr:polysaccharide deacetylase family protein [Nocardiopsis sp. CNT312]